MISVLDTGITRMCSTDEAVHFPFDQSSYGL